MNIQKFVWPVAIVIASLILGGFYYATELSKQAQIEKQQQDTMAQQAVIAAEKADCVSEAQNVAVATYKSTFCYPGSSSANSPECYNGTYLIPQYNNAYDTCLERNGLK